MAYHQLARVLREGTMTGLSDRELLEGYADRGDEAAFETIVARHGPMVLNVCRQLLRDADDVDDAFQATFLALIRKAGSIRVVETLGPWLHAVAARIAARARANRAARIVREPAREPLPEQLAGEGPDCLDTPRIIHEELARLPERLRAPIVLCYLEGCTHEMAASRLGCPVGTVRSRLARARAMLRNRMVRRGLTLPVGAVATLLESKSKGDVIPLHLRKTLIEVATRPAAETAAGVLAGGAGTSASAVALLEGVMNVMRIKTWAFAAAGMASVGILLAAVGTSALSAAGPPDEQAAAVARSDERSGRSSERQESSEIETFPRTYAVGDLITTSKPRRLLGVVQHPTDPRQTPGKAGAPPGSPTIDMMPLIELIATTIEPGSWKIFDNEGRDVSEKYKYSDGYRDRKLDESKLIGSITPFFLSISLIIRTTEETHEKVGTLLRKLRKLDEARRYPGAIAEEDEERLVSPTRLRASDRHDSQVSPTAGRTPANPKRTPSRVRIELLLRELREEVAKLPNEPER